MAGSYHSNITVDGKICPPLFSLVLSFAFVTWAVGRHYLSDRARNATMIATILIASVFWVFLRSDGMD